MFMSVDRLGLCMLVSKEKVRETGPVIVLMVVSLVEPMAQIPVFAISSLCDVVEVVVVIPVEEDINICTSGSRKW